MKIRNGFVSNSSSSSFLVYVGGAANKKLRLGDTDQYLTYSDLYDMIDAASRGGWSSECTDYRELCWSEVQELYDPSKAYDPEAYAAALDRADALDTDKCDDRRDWIRLEISYHNPSVRIVLAAMHKAGIVSVAYDEEDRIVKNEN